MERTMEIARKAPPVGKITFEEFLAWADEDTWAEWEDGEVIMVSPASKQHQDLSVWLITVLNLYVRRRGLGWVGNAPFLMRLPKSGQGREPDILFVRSENLDRLKDTYLAGPADLVVEIISPESFHRDRGRKFIEYETDGVEEYWLIDPQRHQAEFYRLGDDAHYHVHLPDAEGVYRADVIPGFWLRVDWLWQSPLPDELEVLRQLGVLQ